MVCDLRGALCGVRSEGKKRTMMEKFSCHIFRQSSDKKRKSHYEDRLYHAVLIYIEREQRRNL